MVARTTLSPHKLYRQGSRRGKQSDCGVCFVGWTRRNAGSGQFARRRFGIGITHGLAMAAQVVSNAILYAYSPVSRPLG